MTFKRRSKSKNKAFVLLILILLGWGAIEVMPMLAQKSDPLYLLYDVSRFQAEMVTHQLNGASEAKSMDHLDSLLQSLYAFRYAHSNLSEATQSSIPLLHSDTMLIDIIFRWQLGGDRGLSEDEIKLLSAVSTDYAELFNHYQQMMDGTSMNYSSIKAVSKMDTAIVEMIKARGRK
jgi:hypothetical protein